jgi:endonuclease-3
MNSKIAIAQLEALKKNTPKQMRLAAEEWGSEWQTLVAIILSARTRDETTIAVCRKLFEAYPAAGALARAREEEIAEIIRPVNFYKNKTKNIISLAEVLAKDYQGEPPHDMGKLVELPGVGRKTANVFMTEIGHDAIGVDTHVSYISQKLGWTQNKDAHKIELDLKGLFPKEKWSEVNRVCVRFGKTHTSRHEKDKLLMEIKKLAQ